MRVKLFITIITVATTLCCFGCAGGNEEAAAPTVTPYVEPTRTFYDPKDASTEVDASEPQWLEIESAILYRACLSSPARQNVFGLYFDEGDGLIELAVDFDYVEIEPCIEAVSFVLCDLDAESEPLDLVVCVNVDGASYMTYVFNYVDKEIFCIWQGEGELCDIKGNVLALDINGVLTEQAV
ncbi:MAG: hypothetical protein Q4C01_02435 [Clostridia bacterium]|nr:hypothetical protein [Clostridia bacterium]